MPTRPVVTATLTLHPSIVRLAQAMQDKLERDAHKGPWETVDPAVLLDGLMGEIVELAQAPRGFFHSEAADVANFAMMFADAQERRQQDGR